jgi:hypothetical protein
MMEERHYRRDNNNHTIPDTRASSSLFFITDTRKIRRSLPEESVS